VTVVDAAAVHDFRRALRHRRLTNVHWIDALYRVYMTAIVGAVVVLTVSDRIGDDAVSGAALETVKERGPAWVGVAAAVAIAIGLRSGSRGGPLALERPDIRHVLMAPVDRGAALRGPAYHQVRYALFVSVVVGAIAGNLAAQRLPGAQLAWIASGALFGLTTAALGYGAAFVASGVRLRPWIATGLAILLVGWAVADAADAVPGGWPSPTRPVGDIAFWPLDFDPVEVVALLVAAAILVIGIVRIGTVSLEAAERRSTLVGQLRFAATLQDVRTVIVLRRQLALEMPRVRPWLRLRAGPRDEWPVWTRGWRGILRWPVSRLGRLVLTGAVAGLAMRGVWEGTTPLIVVGGLALYVASLEAVEPLAQEIDHPSRRDSVPLESGRLHLRHVPVVVAVLIPVGVVAAGAALAVGPAVVGLEVAATSLGPAVLGAAAAGLVNTVRGAPDPLASQTSQAMLPPEAAGPGLVLRTVFPPALATGGLLPVLVARAAVERGDPVAPVMVLPALIVITVFAWVCMWVRMREEMRRSVMAQWEAREAARG
jgi:hypothetical protein